MAGNALYPDVFLRGLFLLVLFIRGVYLKSFEGKGSNYFLIMISSFLPCFYPTCVLFLPPDSVRRYQNSDRKGAVFAALALLQSLFGVFLRFIFCGGLVLLQRALENKPAPLCAGFPPVFCRDTHFHSLGGRRHDLPRLLMGWVRT